MKSNRIIALAMTFVLLFSAVPVKAFASALPETDLVGEVINLADYSADVAKYQAECENAMKTMNNQQANGLHKLLGLLGVFYFSGKTIYTTTNDIQNIGAYIRENWLSLPEEEQVYVASIIKNYTSNNNYYETRKLLIPTRIKSMFDTLFGNVRDVEGTTIELNEGHTAQTIVPESYIYSLLGSDVGDVYNSMSRALYTNAKTAISTYYIYEMPIDVTIALINPDSNKVQFYYNDGTQFLTSTSNRLVYYRTDSFYADKPWAMSYFTSPTLWGDVINEVDYGNFYVLQGSTLEDAVPLNIDVELELDRSNETEEAVLPAEDVALTPNEAETIMTGDAPAEELLPDTEFVPESEVDSPNTDNPSDTDTGLGATILNALKSFLDLLIEALKGLLRWLFVPSADFLDGWIESMIETIENRTGILTYPLALTISYLGKIADIEDADAVLTIPEVKWKGSVLIQKQTFNFDAFLAQNAELATFYGYYMIVARAILIFAVLRLAWKKGEEMMEG